jgi:hypothetical protein
MEPNAKSPTARRTPRREAEQSRKRTRARAAAKRIPPVFFAEAMTTEAHEEESGRARVRREARSAAAAASASESDARAEKEWSKKKGVFDISQAAPRRERSFDTRERAAREIAAGRRRTFSASSRDL